MGMLGKLFDDGNNRLRGESDEDGQGEPYRPRFDIDLDSGVVRMPNLGAVKPADAAEEPGEPDSD